MIGTGAIRRLTNEIAELRRMWLLQEYHGQRIGYRLVQALFDIARSKGYRKVCLQTNHVQTEAVIFYRKVGFYEIPSYNLESDDDLSMEIAL